TLFLSSLSLHDALPIFSIPNLRNDNDDLRAKIEELNLSLVSLKNENEKLIAKARDFDVCNATIFDLRTKSDMLHAKVVELESCRSEEHTPELEPPFELE